MSRQSSLGAPLPASKLLPSSPGFDPEAYLAVFHGGSSAAQLGAGVRALERQLGESTGQLKQLVKQNFERFISCKTTIDDIYDKLHRIESSHAGVSTEVLGEALREVQDGAGAAFGPILARSAKAERIRSVQALLRRFAGLFSAPQRVRDAAAARDYEQVAAEWRKARALIRPGPNTNKVWASLYGEIEQRVCEAYVQQCAEVQDLSLAPAAATELVGHMLALQAEGLPAAQGADPLAMLLAAREQQFSAAIQCAGEEHVRALGRLRAAIAASARDERMQDPASITEAQLLRWQGSWDEDGGGASGSARAAALHHRRSAAGGAGAGAASSTGAAAAAAAAAAAGGAAAFAHTVSGHRCGVPQAAGDAAIAALEAATGPSLSSLPPAAAAAIAAQQGGAAWGPGALAAGLAQHSQAPGSRHLAELAPLSGLQPPAPRSHIVRSTQCTAGEGAYLAQLERLSAVLLDCLPGLWQAAGGPHRLALPDNLPSSDAARLQETLDGARGITKRLVEAYCEAAGALLQALAGVGPLREAVLLAAEEVAAAVSSLEAQKAPSGALAALRRTLGAAVGAAVQRLAAHLGSVPPLLVAGEAWQLSLTHAGDQTITLLPEQLQEEVTVAMQYYQQLLECATGGGTGGGGTGGSIAAAAARLVGPDASTRPIRDAYFACLEDFVKNCMAATDHLRPAAGAGGAAAAAAGAGGGDGGGSAARRRHQQHHPSGDAMSAAAAAAILGRESWDDDTDVEAEGTFGVGDAAGPAAAAGSGGGGGGPVLRLALSADVKLLLISSNLCYLREKLVGSMTQRFLLVLTGEVAAELQRCSRAVMRLAGRLDNTVQAVHAIYVDRKRTALDRLIAAHIQADGGAVGLPPKLRNVSPQAQQLVAAVAAVQSETLTYAKPFTQQLLHDVLGHLGGSLVSACAALPHAGQPQPPATPSPSSAAAAAAAAAGGSSSAAAAGGTGGCPVEALAQYFMDLVFLEATLSKAGPPSLTTDLTAAYHLLATRICTPAAAAAAAGAAAGAKGPPSLPADTPLAKSLLAVRDPQELSSKLQDTCRKALSGVLERSSFTLRSLLAATTAPTA